MSDLYYMAEKFGNAIHHMAVADAPLWKRIYDAYVGEARLAHTVGGGRREAQPSPQLLAKMKALAERLTYDGSYETTFLVMSDAEVAAIAEEIYDIYVSIEAEQPRSAQ